MNKTFSQTPGYILNLTNDQQVDDKNYEFDIFLLRTGSNVFEYANNSQYFININPAIKNGGTLTFTIVSGTCELNAVQQVLTSKVSFDAVNNRLRIAAHSPSGAGTGTMISNTAPGTRLGRFRITNSVTFAGFQAYLSWYNGPTGFFTKIFAYVAGLNVEITNSANHQVNINNNPLPVIISEFAFSVAGNDVTLRWTTAQEIDNSEFEVYRTLEDNNEWVKAGFIRGGGTTSGEKKYKFEDKKLQTAVYSYKLKQIDYNGNFEFFTLQDDVTVGKPGKIEISQNYPNPSNPKSKIDYQLPEEGNVTIKIYDITGREVSTLVDETKKAGYYSVEFDGTNLASGVYFYRLMSNGFNQTRKMVLIK
jgi:hypothetical protein